MSGEAREIAKTGAALVGSGQPIAQTVEKVKDPEIAALMAKVKLTPATEMQTDDEATLPATRVDNIAKLLNLLYNQRKEPHRDY